MGGVHRDDKEPAPGASATPAATRAPTEPDGESPFGLLPLLVLLVLIGGGIFLVFELRDVSNVQDCVWSGRKNCAPVGSP